MIKKYDEIKSGDVFKCEYGDFDNIVTVVFEKNVIEYKDREPKWLKTIGHYKSGGQYEGYSPIYYGRIPDYNVVEEAK